jgi:GntR family transcriptional regulator
MSWEDRSSRIQKVSIKPLYEQVADDIQTDIESGALPVDAKLPGRDELAEIYQVSYVTTRRATRHLEEKGFVQVRHGRGTFVVSAAGNNDENRPKGIDH